MIIDSLENKQLIVKNFMIVSAYEGWTIKALEVAFEKSNIDKKFIPLIFEDKIFSIIDFITSQRFDFLQIITHQNFEFTSMRLHQKISFLVFNLLKIDENNKTSLARLKNFYLDFKNFIPTQNRSLTALNSVKPIKKALQNLYLLADYIWNLCGDNSTDYNYYTKRIILAKLLLRSFLFFIKDSSQSSNNTQKFIDKEIAKILKFGKLKKSSKEKFDMLKKHLNENILDKNLLQNPQEFLKKLPFLRLIKK